MQARTPPSSVYALVVPRPLNLQTLDLIGIARYTNVRFCYLSGFVSFFSRSNHCVEFIRAHKKCTVKHAFFFNKPEDRDTFLQGGTPTFLEGPDRHGKMRRRRSDDSDDEEYVPKAKRRSSPPLPFSTIAANHHQPYQPSQTPDTLHNLDPLQDL